MALLRAYMLNRREGQSLETYLNENVFTAQDQVCLEPDPVDVEGFKDYLERYKIGLAI